MTYIEELINYENECIYLDFKKEEYKNPKKHELLKDAMAFANADFKGDRFIIIGISKNHREIQSFDINDPADDAQIQQYIIDNIIPELKVSYMPFNFDGKNLMVLTIHDPKEQPYSLKKDITLFGGQGIWKKSEIKIRKGSATFDANVEDLRKMFSRTASSQETFDGKIRFTFDNSERTIELTSSEGMVLPSDLERETIEMEFQKKEKLLRDFPKEYSRLIMERGYNPQEMRYMGLPELKSLLVSVKDRFEQKDRYFLGEQSAHQIQFNIYNDAERPLEDVSIIIKFPFHSGFHIEHTLLPYPNQKYTSQSWEQEQINYPTVIHEFLHAGVVNTSIGDVRHQLTTDVFKTKLRAWFEPSLIGQTIIFTAVVHARNLPKPLSFELKLIIK